MTKQDLRSQIAQSRAALSPEARNAKSEAMQAHLLQNEAWQAAHTLFTFISMQTEVCTDGLLSAAWAQGKQVAVPVTQVGGQMVFVCITPDTPLQKTKYGTREPAMPSAQQADSLADMLSAQQADSLACLPSVQQVHACAAIPQPEPHAPRILTPSVGDLFLVPGLVFDTQGNRYGYGGGFYDRYLAKYPCTQPIALAFALQISATPLEAQPHDIPMQAIVTEHGWISPLSQE